jgi:hypothetical protein
LDFYLTEYNIAIECQGIQHFEPKKFFGGDSVLEEIKKRDDRKLKKCFAHNIKMIYVIDNEKYLENKYHFDNAEPFSGNVSYQLVHINHFENRMNHLVDIQRLVGEIPL